MKTDPKSSDWPYHDIVGQPHHVSKKHPQMDLQSRAAQFAPFAALTGYGEAIEETARLTDVRIELDEMELEELNHRFAEALQQGKEIRITFFRPDERKEGGAYVDTVGRIKKIESGQIIMDSGLRIPVEDILQGWM